jgi:4-amino-4-deoxy-L-arabinose transferase-like glycosyltransferase
VAAAALRFYHIGSQSLWIDEGFTLLHSDTQSIASTLRLILASNGTERFSPLYPLLMHGVIRTWGNSEPALRSISAVCGVAAVVAVMAAAVALFDRRTAILAGALMAASSFAVWYSQEARPYSLMLLLVSLQVWALGRCLRSERRDHTAAGRVLMAVISGVGLFGNILFAISTVSLSVAHLLVAPDRRRWWSAWWPAALASVPAMVFYLASPVTESPGAAGVTHLQQNVLMNLGYTIFGQLFGLTYGPPQAALRGLNKLSGVAGYLPALASAVLLGLALVAALLMARRLRTSGDPTWSNCALLEIAIVLGVGCAGIFVAVTHLNWQPRHAYFVFPPALLVVSFSLSVLSRASHAVRRGQAVVTVVALLGANAWSVYNYYAQPQYGKDDYRGVAAYLNQSRMPGVPSILLFGKAELMRYYGDSETIDLTDVPDSGVVSRVRALSAPAGEVVVAINRKFYWWGGTEPAVVFGAAFDVQELRAFQYFDVYRLRVRATS